MMLARLRTFRLVAALMAATMLFGSTLPLVQHAYAMAQAHRNLDGFAHAMPSGLHHTAMQHHASSSDESMPCHKADDAEQHPATPETCCFLKAAAQADTTAPILRNTESTTTAPLPTQPLVLPDAETHQPTGFWLDTGPPRARSIALHLLHAAFLI